MSYGSPPSSGEGTSALVVSLGVVVVVLLAVVGIGGWLVLGRDDPPPAATTSSAGTGVSAPAASESAATDDEPVDEAPTEAAPTEDEDPTNEEASTGDSPTEDPAADATPASEESTPLASDDAPPSLATAEEPVAAVEGELPGVTMEVLPLRRDGDQVTLQVALTLAENAEELDGDPCRFAAVSPCSGLGSGPDDLNDFAGPTLVDVVNGQRHLVLREAESGECLCSRRLRELEPGARIVLYASFPAPPDDVTTMTVEVPRFPAVPEVPVS